MKVEVIGKRVDSSGTENPLLVTVRSWSEACVSKPRFYQTTSSKFNSSHQWGPANAGELDVIADDNCTKFTRYCKPLCAAHGKLVYLKYSLREPFNILQLWSGLLTLLVTFVESSRLDVEIYRHKGTTSSNWRQMGGLYHMIGEVLTVTQVYYMYVRPTSRRLHVTSMRMCVCVNVRESCGQRQQLLLMQLPIL